MLALKEETDSVGKLEAFLGAALAPERIAPHHAWLMRHLERLDSDRKERLEAARVRCLAMRARHKAKQYFFDRVRAQAGFTTRECEALTALARKHNKTFEEVANAARKTRAAMREFG
jgi:hypothetical protein